jgi:hypothetical protein
MSVLRKLQKTVLNLIVFLVCFEILCFVIMFLATILKWAFLTEGISSAFFSGFGVGLGALVALAILHITLSFNSVSISLAKIAQEADIEETGPRSFKKIMGAVLAIMLVIVTLLWFAEFRVKKYKVMVAFNALESISSSEIADKAIQLIGANATLKEIDALRDTMSSGLGEGRGLSLLIPVDKFGKSVYYELRPWLSETELSKAIGEANLTIFIPYDNEKKKFKELLEKKNGFYSISSHSLRVFCPVIRDDKIAFILMLDTSRHIPDLYSKGRRY